MLAFLGLVSLGWQRHRSPIDDFSFFHLDWVLQPHLPYWGAHLFNLATFAVGAVFMVVGMVAGFRVWKI
jgi:hypothetical protein